MKLAELTELVRSTLREKFMDEMSQNDVHFKVIMKFYDKGTSNAKKAISLYTCGKPNAHRNDIVKELMEMGYRDIQDVMNHFKLKTEYFDKKGTEHVAAALPQTQEETPEEEKLHNEGQLNELGFLVTAGAAAVGVIGAIALLNGASWLKNKLGDAAYAIGDKLGAWASAKAAIANREQLEKTIKPMVSKFSNDSKLKQMYSELPDYKNGGSKKASENNKIRTQQLKKIGDYIKSKLTDDEKKYFTDISKHLRTGGLGENINESKDCNCGYK